MTADRFRDLRSRCRGVSPGIFAADPGRLYEAASQAASWGGEILHFDVMDGAFVPALTGGPAFVRSLDVGLVRDVHLMVNTPSQHVAAFADAGADIITIHAEANDAAEAVAGVRAASARLKRPLMVGLWAGAVGGETLYEAD